MSDLCPVESYWHHVEAAKRAESACCWPSAALHWRAVRNFRSADACELLATAEQRGDRWRYVYGICIRRRGVDSFDAGRIADLVVYRGLAS